jgi:hypothetical protein
VQELERCPLEKLTEIPGFGEKTAEKLLGAAREYLAAHPAAPPEGAPAELEFTPEMEAAPDAGHPPDTGPAEPAAAPEPPPGRPPEAAPSAEDDPATPNPGGDRVD